MDTSYLKCQVGLQTAFDTAVTPTIQLPLQGDYEDRQEIHVAPYDAGERVAGGLRSIVYEHARVKAAGTARFELLPVFLNSMFEDVAPNPATDPYTHTYVLSPSAISTPKPLTWLLGAEGTDLGATGPAVKIKNWYGDRLTLSGNYNSKAVTLAVEGFGAGIDDNAGAGYDFAAVVLLTNMDTMNALLGTIAVQDATTTGGDFLTMTALSGALVDWQLTIVPGIKPLPTLDGNSQAFSAIQYVRPSIVLAATIRTTAANYALVRLKQRASTYQELQLKINGASHSGTARVFTCNLTGLFTAVPTAHGRKGDEVTMDAMFTMDRYFAQTTTPHLATLITVSRNNWT